MVDAVQHLNPYRETALDYKKAGWHGPLPIPHKQKNPPPTGYTGHRAPYPELDKINEWRKEPKRKNICVRLAGVDKEHEVIGIDVDHYQSGDKHKRGGDQLKDLENRFGVLPDTWISSSRTDGISGIRYYRVPRGMAFRGQVEKDIECISKGYRFAVVWPSIHPSGETYWWFPHGVLPDAAGRNVWKGELPNATDLPILPESWLDYLTNHRMRADVDERIDMDSKEDEIWEWCDATLHGDDDTEMCSLMAEKVDKHIEKIRQEATSHDKIVNAHYNIAKLAIEGHLGYVKAISEVQTIWAEEVLKRDKRGIEELRMEAYRSRINAFRKIKAQSDEQVKIGANAILERCDKTGQCGSSDDGDSPPPVDHLSDIPVGAVGPVGEYRMNDDGNADHFIKQWSNLLTGPSMRYAKGYGWIIWHGGEEPSWHRDEDGETEVREMWQVVRDNQEHYVETALKTDWEGKKNNFDNQIPGTSADDVKFARQKYDKWRGWAEKSGNNSQFTEALRRVSGHRNVRISINELDQKRLLLGVTNGILELGQDDIRLRPAEPGDLVTLNTNVAYEKPSKLAMNVWEEYLTTFLPDVELRRIVQIVMGHCLIGGNPEKRIIVLKGESETGKSTMLGAIQAALGEYASPINETVFQSSHFSEVLVHAMNKRVVVCSEFDASIELSASVIKRLTGGDTISQAIKFSNAVREGEPQFVTILGTNNTPKIVGADKALQNRLFVIPFETKPVRIDRAQRNVVENTCATAVLWWLIEGYRQYRVLGELPTSKLIEDKTEEFMSELDEVATFLHEAVQKHDKIGMRIEWKNEPEWCMKRESLFSHYKQWCEINEIPERHRLSPHMFTKRIKSLGVPGSDGLGSHRINGVLGRWWFGVKPKKLRRGGNVYLARFGPDVALKSDTDDEK